MRSCSLAAIFLQRQRDRVANQLPKGTPRLAERVPTLRLVVRTATSIVCLTIVEVNCPSFGLLAVRSKKHTAPPNHRRKVGRRVGALFALLSARHASRTEVPPQGTNRQAFSVAFVYPRGSNSS